MKKVFLAFFIVFCTGCANKVWMHSSKSQQDFYQDCAKCEAMSNSAGSGQIMYGGSAFANGWNQGSAIGSSISRDRIFKNCMMGEGWYLADLSEMNRRAKQEHEDYLREKEAQLKKEQQLSEKRLSYKDKTVVKIINGNAVLIDSVNMLMWPCLSDTSINRTTWHKAMSAANIDYAGYKDWRLPTIEELSNLTFYFDKLPSTEAQDYWSSSAYDDSFSKYINAKSSDVSTRLKDQEANVLPVRSVNE